MTHNVYILLGTNRGNPMQNMVVAKNHIIEKVGETLLDSSFYRTAAWGNTHQEAFINQVILVRTKLMPEAVLEKLLEIEHLMGRERKVKWEPRIIDLDILFYDDFVISENNLIIPHTQIQNRRFTLVPLCEIAPNWIHPELHKSMLELLEICPDQLAVEKL